MGSIPDRPVKIENYNTILMISSIISGCAYFIYLPIIVTYLCCKGTFNRLKVLQFQLVISAMLQSLTYFYQGYSTQEYLCISKGPLNFFLYFCNLTTATLIVFISYNQIWNPNSKSLSCSFILSELLFSWGIPLIYTILVTLITFGFLKDYNHPCWIHDKYSVIIYFSLSFIYNIIAIGYLILSIYRLGKYIKKYGNNELTSKFLLRLIKYLIFMILCFFLFVHRFSMYLVELNGKVIREFWIILLKYIIESLGAPLYVIIYCYTRDVMNSLRCCCFKDRSSSTKTNSSDEINTNSIIDDNLEANNMVAY